MLKGGRNSDHVHSSDELSETADTRPAHHEPVGSSRMFLWLKPWIEASGCEDVNGLMACVDSSIITVQPLNNGHSRRDPRMNKTLIL